jgi:hypothetical protein
MQIIINGFKSMKQLANFVDWYLDMVLLSC